LSDEIVIRIPASTPHIGLVRATASALAAHLDFTYDRITDLHIALDEVCSRILATSRGAGRIEVTFSLEGGAIRVSARGDAPRREGTPFLTPWAEMILRSVTDRLEIAETDGSTSVVFEVAKGVAA
jgi:serine/threonine-protein kinase RsbW